MERYKELVPMFEDMAELHKILLKMRKRRGAIEFEDDEAKIILDDDGHPIDIQLRNRGTSERMVESFMLKANRDALAEAKQSFENQDQRNKVLTPEEFEASTQNDELD